MGFVSEAPLASPASTGPCVLVEFERCRVCDRAEVAVASDVAVVVVGGGGEPMGWRGCDEAFGALLGTEEGGVFFGALSVRKICQSLC